MTRKAKTQAAGCSCASMCCRKDADLTRYRYVLFMSGSFCCPSILHGGQFAVNITGVGNIVTDALFVKTIKSSYSFFALSFGVILLLFFLLLLIVKQDQENAYVLILI